MSEDRSSSEEARPAPQGRDGEHESWIERLLTGLRLKAGPSIREDLADALDTNLPGGEFTPIERSLLKNVLSLRELRVNDVMVPRADIVAVQASATLASVLHLFRTAGHSRIPVYGENLDEPLGMVHIRDFVDYIAARAETAGRERLRRNVGRGRGDAPVEVQAQAVRLGVDLEAPLSRASILRPVLFVPPSMPAMDLLVKMQTTRTHMALVIDEYGGTDGLVSMEDIVEMIVGDIEDEHDDEEASQIVADGDERWIIDARASLEDVSEALGVELADADIAEEVDTLGGLIVTLAGRVPVRGELVPGPEGLEFEILDADPRRLKKIRIHKVRTEPALVRRAARRAEGGAEEAPAPVTEDNVTAARDALEDQKPGAAA
ncbi:CBS domain/Transporter associated domain [Chelatococcus sambhunathii]|uniref:CBS domain/Transporter associated domain n=1 Tax=Chelatococcus sambhunathii TaxID=363953 RepID=A0ABM9U5F5_9HYPH|nr:MULTISPECIES: hemolysin family protein [Chelatococcus]CUA88722.1 CBS domain/Transporter associated domain [Chelatococcus sambhunathii]